MHALLNIPPTRIALFSRIVLLCCSSLFFFVYSFWNAVPLRAQPGDFVPCFRTGTGFNGNTNFYAQAPNGKILCAGAFTTYNGAPANRICRLNADGSLDATFTNPLAINGEINYAQPLSNGQILISGSFTLPKAGIARLNADGTVDASFNMAGTGINGGRIQSFAVQADGKIIVVGGLGFTQYNGVVVNAIARLNADGSLDATFNSGVGSGFDGASFNAAVVVQPDGKILVGGDFTTYKSVAVPRGIIRLNSDGSRDNAFNPGMTGGVAGFSGSVGFPIIALPNGQILICGNFSSYNGFPHNCLARLNADGSPDNTFNPAGPNVPGVTMGRLADGRLLVAGNFTQYDGVARSRVALASPNGVLDLSFNPVGSNGNTWTAIALPDGTAILGGQSGSFTQYNGVMVNGISRVWLTNPAGVVSSSPLRNTHNNALSTPLALNFTEPMSVATASASVARVWGGQTGLRLGAYTGGGTNAVTFTPAQAYRPGELVSATLMCGAQTSMGAPAKPSVVQFRARAGVGAGVFPSQFPGSPFYLGAISGPIGVAVADFDNDGDMDMVTADNNMTAERISVLTNNGSGAFSIAPYFCPPYRPRGITTADVNNDGWQDIVAIDQGGFVVVFMNNGAGVFGAPAVYAGLGNIINVSVGDADADGDIDVLVSGAGGVRVLFNTGNGLFGPSLSVGGGFAAVFGDVDNDGDLDVLSATNGGSVNIFFNNGAVGFSTPTNVGTVGANNNNIVVGDMNGDGALDIVTGHDDVASSVAVLLNNGVGGFTPAGYSPIAFPVNSRPRSVSLADVDGDGDLDMAIALSDAHQIAVLINNAGSFVHAFGSPYPVVGTTPWQIATADFDGDGDIDIATANNVTHNVSVFINAPALTVSNYNASASVSPPRNTSNAPLSPAIDIAFTQNLTAATATVPPAQQIFHVHGGFTGSRTRAQSAGTPLGAYSLSAANTARFTPSAPFRPGEQVFVTVTNARATSGSPTRPFVYDFRVRASVGPATFHQTATPTVGADARTVAAADFDGDGDLDLAVGSPSQVDILLNNGTGVFTLGSQILSGALGGLNPWTVTAGDFNNDGFPDLAVAGPLPNTSVYILLNNANGTGAFTVAGNYGVVNIVWQMTSADLDGDGDLDLAVPNQGGNTVSILLNNGDGTFISGATPTVGLNPRCVAAADFDDDGDVDIAVGNQSNNFVSVLLNTGNGTFSPAANIPTTGANPVFVAAGDLDNDGKIDLAVANSDINTVQIFKNIGSGNFMNLASYPTFGAWPGPVFVSMADFDGNGALDLAAVNYGSTDISILLNNGSASFTNAVKYPVISAPNYLAAGDFDGDGDLDLAVTNSGLSDKVSLLKNGIQPVLVALNPARNAVSAPNASAVALTYNQTMTTATASVPALNIWGGFSGYKTGGTRSVAGGTVTANVGGFRSGEQVWVTATSAQTSLSGSAGVAARPLVYGFTAKAGAGPGTFVRKSSPALANNGIVVLGDVDNDGDLDIAATEGALVEILFNDGKANFTSGGTFAGGPGGCIFADMDNDGYLDLVVVNVTTSPSQITVRLNNGSGNFATTLGPFNSATDYSVINVGDVNGDGYLDIVAANNNGGSISVLLNNGNGTLALRLDYSTGGSVPNGIALGDVDNDGDIDVVVTNNGSHTVSVMLNDGQGAFPLPSVSTLSGTWIAFTNSATPTSVALGDVNGDGYLDIAVVAEGIAGMIGSVDVRLNDGMGGFTNSAPGSPFLVPSPDNSSAMIALADVDGDGDLDLATGRRTGGALIVRLNDGSGNFSASAVGSPYPTIGGTFGIASGDLDGDGDVDFIAGSEGTLDINIFLNASQPILTAFSPPRNTQTLAPTTPLTLTYNQSMTTATASVQPFRVWGNMRGFRSGTYSQPSGAASAQIALSPPLLPNEEVFVTVTNAQNGNAIAARPFALHYRAASSAAPGTFFALPPIAIGSTPAPMRYMAAADFNGDGIADLAISNSGANGVQIMYGTGAGGGFSLGPLVGVGGGLSPQEIAVGDFNSDGRMDIVISVSGSNMLVVLMNTGGAFAPTSFPIPSRGLTVADFNNDGALDIASIDNNMNTIQLFMGANNGAFSFGTILSAPIACKSVAAADVDNDGDMDIIAVSPNADARIFLNAGDASFDYLTLAGSAVFNPEYAYAADFNRDGNMDFVTFAETGAAFLTLFTGNGAGGFTATAFGSGVSTGFANVGDIDGDGWIDVVVSDITGVPQIWRNTGGGFSLAGLGQGALGGYPVLVDTDNDGDLDVVMTNWTTEQVHVLLNQAAPTLTVNPLTLDFGAVAIGQTATLNASVNGTNLVGNLGVGITRATVSAFSYAASGGTSQTQGTITIPGGVLLNLASLVATLNVTFAPSTSGVFTTTVTVTTASASPLSLTLTGVGVLPRIPAPPVITALSTNALLVGLPVTVTGLNFTNVSQASVGGIATTVNVLSATEAVVIVPAGFSVGQIVLTNIDGTAVSRDSVRAIAPFAPPPVIAAAAPLVGVAGDIVRVTGANFSTGATTVLVGGVAYGATFLSTTNLTFTLLPAMQGAIGVRTPNGSTSSSFIVRVIPPPTIQSLSPTQARNGETFSILGENFFNVLLVTAANMRLDSAFREIDTLGRRITVRVVENRAENATIGMITVQTRSGIARFAQAYTAAGLPIGVPEPRIIAVQPVIPGGVLQEGDEILLSTVNIPTGATFALSVNGVGVTIASVETSSTGAVLRARLPLGIVPLSLQTASNLEFQLRYGALSTSATFFLPLRAANIPAFTSFSPSLGGTCSTLSLLGQNFGVEPRGRVTGVLVGGVPALAFRVVSSERIHVTLGTVASGPITLLFGDGANVLQISTSALFTFDPDYACLPAMRREDSLALDAFYVATVGLNWTTSTNWTNPDVPAALRFGVKTEGDRVTEIRLPANNVGGSIPEFIMQNLRALKALDLQDNIISAALPNAIVEARELEILRLGGNRFGGLLPDLRPLARLRELDISRNNFVGTLDTNWVWEEVEILNFRRNRFTGRVSDAIGRLKRLRVLNLSDNALSDTLPAALGELQELQILNLRGNRFTGRIPRSLGAGASSSTSSFANAKNANAKVAATERLLWFDASDNQLSGDLPEELGALETLRALAVDNNALSGVVPPAIARLQRLQTLGLSGNRFSDIPPLRTAIARLDTLRIAANLLDFASLEKQIVASPLAGAAQPIPHSATFSYAPQNTVLRIAEAADTTAIIDESFELRIQTGGANNLYTWWKDSTIVQAASTRATFSVPVVAASDSGAYRCVVTSALFPDLSLQSAPLRVETLQPSAPPGEALRLLSPEIEAEGVSPMPTFVWTSVRGARQYRLEVSALADFSTLIADAIIPQTAQTLASGKVEFLATRATPGFPLAASAKIFWRVRAENASGLGAGAVGEFTTAAGDALVNVDRVDFGRVPRGDLARRTIVARNIGADALRIESLSADNAAFRVVSPAQPFVLAAGRDTTLTAEFRPSAALVEFQSGIIAQFRAIDSTGALGAAQSQTLPNRLRGRGGALKIIAPDFGEVAVRETRIVAALLVNVSERELDINGASLFRRDQGFELRSGEIQRANLRPADTVPVILSFRSFQAGQAWRDSLRVQTNLENVAAELQAVSKPRSPNVVPVRIAVRSAENNLPPGAPVTLELTVAPLEGFTLHSVFKAATPLVRATVRVNRNVLALSPAEGSARARIQSGDDFQSLILPVTTWDGRSPIIAQIRCVVVAGKTDSTLLQIEQIEWGEGNVVIDSVAESSFQSQISRAGGRRFVAPRLSSATLLKALTPNPASEYIDVEYILEKSGFASVVLTDVRGNEILTAYSEVHSAGRHTRRIKTEGLASGIYVIQLRIDDEVLTQQAVIVR
jgi:uncharacterized delta-60 repeat protein